MRDLNNMDRRPGESAPRHIIHRRHINYHYYGDAWQNHNNYDGHCGNGCHTNDDQHHAGENSHEGDFCCSRSDYRRSGNEYAGKDAHGLDLNADSSHHAHS